MVAAGSGYDVQALQGKEPIVPIKGSCHCGQTQFEVSEPPAEMTRCTCSLCSKRGALWAYYTPAQFRLTSPPENVATYLWGSRTVKHHFCASCGCGTYSESPDWSSGKPDFDNPKVAVAVRRFRSRRGAGDGDRWQKSLVRPASAGCARQRTTQPVRRTP
jgi:hypothetical protein